ncbi:MAG: virginiamycin lyase [Myxococcales bacterium]|jgi:streptogramin lyase|nr:virginiamycin lyase [Myxococcales bacterium]
MPPTTTTLLLITLATTGLACAAAPADDGTAEVTASLVIASSDVRCINVKAVGTTTVTTQADVQGQMSSVLLLTGIPVGGVTFTASAFSVRCAGATTATYVSDPVTATVAAGTPLTLSFKMRPASAMGTGSATLDFPQAHGRTDEFLPSSGSGTTVTSVEGGPDGNIWFGMGSNGVGVMSPAGKQLVSFNPANLATGNLYDFEDLAFGPDDNLWFVDLSGLIGRMTTSGTVKGFAVSGFTGGSIAAGPDGNMWFTDSNGPRVGKMTPLGISTMFPIPTPVGFPTGIAAGADGNLWFTEASGNKIGKVTPAGVITEFTVPTASARPTAIAAGPDGNLWFTELVGNKIGRITTAGVITEFAFAITGMKPAKITRGADGNLWAACGGGGAIAKVTTAGVITLYPAASDSSSPADITAGPDGNIWFGETPRVGRLTP